MRKKLIAVLLVSIVTMFQLPSYQSKAIGTSVSSSAVSELKTSSVITQWVLDEPSNTLYAISEASKTLLFINTTTMVVEKSLTLDNGPTDVIKDGGKLYISIDKAKEIVVVDAVSKSIVKTLNTKSDPYRIVKDGNRIYYATLDQFSQIYQYNLDENTDQELTNVSSVYQPDLAINKDKHLLYIGESALSGSNMIYYNTLQNKIVQKTSYDDGYGFYYPKRSVIYDGTNVFYAGRDFISDNATRIHGDFDGDETVIFAKYGLVYTSKSVYDEDTHEKLGNFNSNLDLVEASQTTLYTYQKDTGSIKKFSKLNTSINRSNIISIVSGKNTEIPRSTKSFQINNENKGVEMNSEIVQWVLNESTNTLYGISQKDKALFFINASNMNIEKVITFTSGPTDIIKDNGKLYVSLDDANKIAIVDMASRTISNILYTTYDPYRIVKDGNKLYYTERDQWCKIYEYNFGDSSERALNIESLYAPDIAINTKNHLLYIGEASLSSSYMIYYDTAKNSVVGKTSYNNGNEFSYPGRYTLFNDSNVFYAGHDFKAGQPSIIGKYSEDDIIFAKYGLVFTRDSIYDEESHEFIGDFGVDFDLLELSSKDELYTYNKEAKVIIKSDPDKTPPVVTGISNNGLYNSPVTIGFNEGTATLDSKPFTKGSKVSAQGKHVLKVVDESDNSTTVVFTIDSIAPTGSVIINNGAASTLSSKVTLNISANDSAPASGVSYIMISNSADFKGADWIPYVAKKDWSLSNGLGGKTVYVKFKDKAGNISKTFTNTISLKEAVKPTGSIKINNGVSKASTRSVTLNISAVDAAPSSGIGYMMISNSSSFSGASWIKYSSKQSWTLVKGYGNKTVYIKFKDNDGNISNTYSDGILLTTSR